MDVRCALRLRLYLWGDKNLFIGSDRPPYVSRSIIQQSFYEASWKFSVSRCSENKAITSWRKKEEFGGCRYEIEAESTNNEHQLLSKVVPLETHVVIDGGALLRQVFWPGTAFKEIINENCRYSCIFKIYDLSNSIWWIEIKNSQGSLICKKWSIHRCFSWRKCKCLQVVYPMMILKTIILCSKNYFSES